MKKFFLAIAMMAFAATASANEMWDGGAIEPVTGDTFHCDDVPDPGGNGMIACFPAVSDDVLTGIVYDSIVDSVIDWNCPTGLGSCQGDAGYFTIYNDGGMFQTYEYHFTSGGGLLVGRRVWGVGCLSVFSWACSGGGWTPIDDQLP